MRTRRPGARAARPRARPPGSARLAEGRADAQHADDPQVITTAMQALGAAFAWEDDGATLAVMTSKASVGPGVTEVQISEEGLAAKAAPTKRTHYEDPSAGPCQAGELAVRINGVTGGFCSPSCASGPCPTDVPAGTNASPECALETQGASKPSRCALICESSSKCPAKASCKMVQGAIGLCTYDS